MRTLLSMAAAGLLVAGVVLAADSVKSGLQPGDALPAFNVVKCAGADEDGVSVGKELCYRCKYGNRPQVIIFTRSTDENVVALATQMNDLVQKNAEKKLASFVAVIGEDREELEKTATQFGKKNKLVSVPVVVPVEHENGPANYGVSDKAGITVIMAVGSQVKVNHAYAKVDKDAVKAIVGDVSKILK